MRINSIPPKELYYQYVAVKDKVTPHRTAKPEC